MGVLGGAWARWEVLDGGAGWDLGQVKMWAGPGLGLTVIVISEHTEKTLSQKEWEEKLLVVREGRRD